MIDITHIVIPAAGLGTRFLPFTKAVPKEMLPLGNKPALQYIIQEGLQAHIKNFIIVTNTTKHAIKTYFTLPDSCYLLHNKNAELSALHALIEHAHFSYVDQNEPRGLGHAVQCARTHITGDYFGIMLPDDIIHTPHSIIGHLHTIACEYKVPILAVQEIPYSAVSSYGIIAIKKQLSSTLFELADIIEKPLPEQAPSRLAVVGRYILSTAIFSALDVLVPVSGELQLTDALAHLIRSGQRMLAYKIQERRSDTGTPLGWLKAALTIACADSQVKSELQQFIDQL